MFDLNSVEFWLCAMVAMLGATAGLTFSLYLDKSDTSWWPTIASVVTGLGIGMVVGSLLVGQIAYPGRPGKSKPVYTKSEPLHQQGFCRFQGIPKKEK